MRRINGYQTKLTRKEIKRNIRRLKIIGIAVKITTFDEQKKLYNFFKEIDIFCTFDSYGSNYYETRYFLISILPTGTDEYLWSPFTVYNCSDFDLEQIHNKVGSDAIHMCDNNIDIINILMVASGINSPSGMYASRVIKI